MKLIVLVVAVLSLLIFPGSDLGRAGELSGSEIMARAGFLEISDDMEAEIKMEIIRNDQVRKREMIMQRYFGEKTEKTMVRFTAPEEVRGTGFLSITHPDGEEESWIYMPAIGVERQIVSDERGEGLMGSDFTYEDIFQAIEDYEYELLETVELNGRKVYRVEAVPAAGAVEDAVDFASQISYIDREKFYLHQVRYFDQEGQEIRRLISADVQEIKAGLYLPLKMTMENLENEGRTILTYKRVDIDIGLDPEDFSRDKLISPLD